MADLPPKNPRTKKPKAGSAKGNKIVQQNLSDAKRISKGVSDKIKLSMADAIMAFPDMQNGFVESFNGKMRDELLNETLFFTRKGRGLERQTMTQSPTDEEGTAFHEAGHAVLGAIRGRNPISVTIVVNGCAAGKTEFPEDCVDEFKNHFGDSPEKHAYIETRILIAVAGTIAHDLRFPGRDHDAGDRRDENLAGELIEDNAGWADDDREIYFQKLRRTAQELLKKDWPWVEAVACALIERKTISTTEVMMLRPVA